MAFFTFQQALFHLHIPLIDCSMICVQCLIVALPRTFSVFIHKSGSSTSHQ